MASEHLSTICPATIDPDRQITIPGTSSSGSGIQLRCQVEYPRFRKKPQISPRELARYLERELGRHIPVFRDDGGIDSIEREEWNSEIQIDSVEQNSMTIENK
jgi:hypothetical protein